MKTILIYDPAMCCSTGVCGPEVDPLLPRFAGMLAQLEGQGVKVERYNLAQQPLAFAQNPTVRALLEKEGPEVLPLIFVDGEIEMKGRYPETEERSAFMKRAREADAKTTSQP
ncbi:MAG: arsenite efflux transporter metallochaperone ArsD [Opitutales bacterium]